MKESKLFESVGPLLLEIRRLGLKAKSAVEGDQVKGSDAFATRSNTPFRAEFNASLNQVLTIGQQ